MSRFSADVEIAGGVVRVHVANSGRLRELLVPGAPVWLTPQPSPMRRTAWDLSIVAYQGLLVSIDSRVPNALVGAALANGLLAKELTPAGGSIAASSDLNDLTFAHPVSIGREVTVGTSRLDFLVEAGDERCYVEAKSVTLVVDGVARFPDAPTTRGARHLNELALRRAQGDRALVAFVIQREDATAFTPNVPSDPAFATALHAAAAAGVEIRAYRCTVSLTSIELAAEIPVLLEGESPSPR